jgi:hypothetical protein
MTHSTPLRWLGALMIAALVAACGAPNDLGDAPPDLGNFRLGHNIVVTENMQMVPISRPATEEEWTAALKQAIDDRFSRFQGDKLYHIGINIDAYALAPPGIPVVVSPKSVLVISANIWDDAAGVKLHDEPRQFTVFESLSGATVVGSGLTQTKEEQMANLSRNAAYAVQRWMQENPEWFGLPARRRAPTTEEQR